MITSSAKPSRMRRRTLFLLLLCATTAAALQALLNWVLKDGMFGRTPASAVFGPFALWAAADVGTLVVCAKAMRRDRLTIAALTLLMAACATGTYLAWSGVTGFLQVY